MDEGKKRQGEEIAAGAASAEIAAALMRQDTIILSDATIRAMREGTFARGITNFLHATSSLVYHQMRRRSTAYKTRFPATAWSFGRLRHFTDPCIKQAELLEEMRHALGVAISDLHYTPHYEESDRQFVRYLLEDIREVLN